MKTILLVICIFATIQLCAQPIIVLDKGKLYLKGTVPVLTDQYSSEELNFIQNVIEAATKNTSTKSDKALITPPLDWGKMESDSTIGQLRHFMDFSNGFYADVKLQNLKPNHEYVLTLNGNPKLEGNELFPELVQGMDVERFYDILRITTDSAGNYSSTIAVQLKPGNYRARFYVKDTEDWKIVLYHDYFKFNTFKP
ncbi:MAG: hypothetical protein ACERKD_24635 [Prolixibacteraceae bacterium]